MSIFQLNWQLPELNKDIIHNIIPMPLRSWLMNCGSLTKILRSTYRDLSVEIIHNSWQELSVDEQKYLDQEIPLAFIREVLIKTSGRFVLYGKTVIPKNSLIGNNRILHIGAQPIGEFLFQQPSVARKEIKISRISAYKLNYYTNENYNNNVLTWARRSIFILKQKPILMYEYFFP